MSKTTAGRKADCLAALTSYLGEASDCELSRAVLPEFLYGFGDFLCNGYERHYSPATATECLNTLRTSLRKAMAEGYVPNLDAMPAVIERLAKEAWANGCAPRGKKGADTSQRLGVEADAERLARSIDAVTVKSKMGADDGRSERERRAEALEARSAAVYLFGLLNYGLEIKEVLELKRDGDPDSIYVEKYGLRLPLSAQAKQLAALANGNSTADDHLFATLDNRKYNGDSDNAARLTEKRVAKFLFRQGLGLYRQKSVTTDWLNLALEQGLSHEAAAALIKHRLGDPAIDSAKLLPALEAAHEAVNAAGGPGLEECWRLMRVISPAVQRSKFVAMLESSGILGSHSEARKHIYAPDEWLTDKERGQQAVMSRYIFVLATPIQTEMANRFTPYARVVRESAKGTFVKISEREIRDLQEMLHDFPDAVELTNRDEWLRRQNAHIAVGCKAVIRSGRLAGKEATIVDIKDARASQPTYLIEYAQGALVFKTSLTGIELDLVATP